MEEAHFDSLRDEMVEQIAAHVELTSPQTGVATLSEAVLAVMGEVPRHNFVPFELRPYAYMDSPLPIGYDKTISQPFINALMTDLLAVERHHRVLEIGTGLGYQSAVLAKLAEQIYSIELIEELSTEARKRLRDSGYGNVELRVGDGALGWPENAPFDRIMLTAAPDLIPPMLISQLKPGGRMVLPAGLADAQQLMVVNKNDAGRIETSEILPVRFSELDVVER